MNLKLRLAEIQENRESLQAEVELLNFFDERVHWEDQAHEKDKLYAEFALDREDENLTEEAYSKSIFDKVRDERKPKVHAKRY